MSFLKRNYIQELLLLGKINLLYFKLNKRLNYLIIKNLKENRYNLFTII